MSRPSSVMLSAVGTTIDTLGKAELEMTAAILVRYYVEHGDEWSSVSRRELAAWMKDDPIVQRWCRNPFFRPAHPLKLTELGLMTGWQTPDEPGSPTPEFKQLLTERGAWKAQKERLQHGV